MNVAGLPRRTIWLEDDGLTVGVIDQTRLPHHFQTLSLAPLADAAHAIRSMQVRGAPLIGVTAAYGVALAMRVDPTDVGLHNACEFIRLARPTAVNLAWAVDA